MIEHAKDMMAKKYGKGITVNDVVCSFYMHRSYFSRLFRGRTGINLSKFLMLIRICRVCRLLENEGIKIGSICLQVGFSNHQRFCAAFKKIIGITPTEYRRQRANRVS